MKILLHFKCSMGQLEITIFQQVPFLTCSCMNLVLRELGHPTTVAYKYISTQLVSKKANHPSSQKHDTDKWQLLTHRWGNASHYSFLDFVVILGQQSSSATVYSLGWGLFQAKVWSLALEAHDSSMHSLYYQVVLWNCTSTALFHLHFLQMA